MAEAGSRVLATGAELLRLVHGSGRAEPGVGGAGRKGRGLCMLQLIHPQDPALLLPMLGWGICDTTHHPRVEKGSELGEPEME